MSDFMNNSVCNNQCPSLSYVLTSDLSPSTTTLSGSSSTSSLNSLFNDQDHGSMNSTPETWSEIDKTSTPKDILSNARIRAFLAEAGQSLKLNYSLDIGDNVLQNPDIFYGGRDLLDLASNIVPYAWQRRAPLLDTDAIFDKIADHHSAKDEDKHEKYTMKYCTSCGFSQPVPPA